MKNFITALCFCALVLPMHAQHYDPCATDDAERQLLEKFPEQAQQFEKLDRFTRQFAADYSAKSPNQRGGFIYVIPVVMHVIHNYGVEYISDDQIYEAMDILNRDFRKRNADTSQIVPSFQDIAADCEIEFRLATVDPWHNPTNGIDRIQSYQTYKGTNESKLNPWPRDLYLNIWITNTVQQSSTGGQTLAYAYRPPSVDGAFGIYDGIVTLSNCVGSTGTGTLSNSRTLTHEVGHFLNLNHTWGNAPSPAVTCGDDGISDTPITAGYWGCNLNGSSCTAGDPIRVIENVQNYMEYSGCSRMFTEGQKVAMQAALNSGVADRDNLWQENTLHFTGADVSTNRNTVAPPIADFNSTVRMACVGESIAFKDFSWRGPITEWEWSFPNGTPATSSDQNPTVSFNSPGWQTVSLKVTSVLGQHEKIADQYVYVTDNNSTFSTDFRNGFENPDQFSNEWIVNNLDHNTTQWQVSNAASYTGGYSLMLNNFQGSYDKDEVITPPYDMANSGSTDLQFRYSYASKSGAGAEDVIDTLTVYYTTNCGKTWTQMYRQTGVPLVTAGNYVYNFVPDKENLWSQVTVALPAPAKASTNVRFKFTFANAGSANNIFIDNININDSYSTTVGINDPHTVASLNVYPVPSTGKFNVELSAFEASTVRVELFDLMGKNIASELHNVTSGKNIIPMAFELPTGIYTLSVSGKGDRMMKKVSIVR